MKAFALPLLLAASLSSPQAALKIVVIAGEGAVNVIEQKTAVAPVVEVRDRNDQPVAGALVMFIVRQGRGATLSGGSSTLRVTTDQAGRAVATGFTPTGPGSIVIEVSATYQGLAATATIAQQTVATAAQAASAAAGASAGGGGGFPITQVAIIGGAAAAGGAVYVTKYAKKDAAPVVEPPPLLGGWVLLSTSNPAQSATQGIGRRRKVFTETTFEVSETSATSGALLFRHGGTYTLDGTSYVETVQFGEAGSANIVGQTFQFTITIEGSTFTQTGENNPFTEVWGRS